MIDGLFDQGGETIHLYTLQHIDIVVREQPLGRGLSRAMGYFLGTEMGF